MSVVCAALAVNAGAAESIPDACRLLSRAEIQGAIGGTATGFEHATTFRDGSTSICQGSVGGATITVRDSIESKQDNANERTIAQMMTTRSARSVRTVAKSRYRRVHATAKRWCR